MASFRIKFRPRIIDALRGYTLGKLGEENLVGDLNTAVARAEILTLRTPHNP